MQDEEMDWVRWIGEDNLAGDCGVAGRLCLGGAQGGAKSRDRDACRTTTRGEGRPIEDVVGEKVDVDDFGDDFGLSSKKKPAFWVPPPSVVIPLARSFGLEGAKLVEPPVTSVEEELWLFELKDGEKGV